MAENTFGQDITQAPGSVVPTEPVVTTPATPPVIPISTITTPAQPAAYQQPAMTPVYNVSTLNTTPPVAPTPLTPAQASAQDLTTSLEGLNKQLIGQSAYRTSLESTNDIAGKTQTVNDLTARLTTLKNEAAAIPMQLQQNAEGRGITAQGLAPIQQDALRNNSIESLTASAQLEAANGNLTTANTLIDRAVSQKFDPINEEINAAKANLQLILNSPEYTNEQKTQAQTQLDQQNARQAQVQKQQDDAKQKGQIAVDAASRGASATVLQQIQDAPDAATAQLISAQSGFSPISGLPASAQEYVFAKQNGYTGSYSDYQNEDANRKAVIAAGGVVTAGAPTSYKEWELAGKPGTYAQFLADSNVKAPTAAQQTVATYAARLEQSNPTIDNLTSYISSLNPIAFETMSRMPSYLQSAQYQQYDQAARNFINSVLRRESGAAISPSEFENAYAQYLPRAGDTADTLAEKKKNRDIVFASLKKAAGNAYQSVDDLLGTAPVAPVGPLKSGYQGTTSSGITFTIQ